MICFTFSPTGGHIYPTVALAEELNKDQSFFFVSTNKKDKQIIKEYNYQFFPLKTNIKNPWQFLKNFIKSYFILKKQKTKIVISAGGYFTFPIALAAYLQKIPVFLLEQNIIAGRTNRILALLAKKIFLSFEEAKKYFPKNKIIVSGNPIRNFTRQDSIYLTLKTIEMPKSPLILVFGGSQGALKINQHFYDNYDYFLTSSLSIIHVTGENFYSQNFSEPNITILKNNDNKNKIIVLPYFEKMDFLYRNADLVISRSGATTLAELMFFHKKAILIPYPYAKDNHQMANAKYYENTKMGITLEEKNISFEELLVKINQLLTEKTTVAKIQNKAKEIILQEINNLKTIMTN